MEFFECVERAIKTRRSHRVYLEKPVDREKLEKIIELEMWAPSAMNRQQWFFVVVSGDRLKKLIDVVQIGYDLIIPRLQRFFA